MGENAGRPGGLEVILHVRIGARLHRALLEECRAREVGISEYVRDVLRRALADRLKAVFDAQTPSE